MKVLGGEFLTSVAITSMIPPSQPVITASHSVTLLLPEADEAESIITDRPVKIDFELEGLYHAGQNCPVPGLNASLKLRNVPRVVIRDYTHCCIDDWGVSIPATEATPEKMSKEAVRNFLGYFNKAQQGTLTDADRKIWRHMLADFDSDEYVEVSAPAIRGMGILKTLRPGYAIIKWSDDPNEDERVDGNLRELLSYLHEGDIFSATVKFVGGKLVALENVVPCNV